ncbi:MAG TPA: hypothetical protein VF624_19185, partial [Tepidisphaeraceae bacterium]
MTTLAVTAEQLFDRPPARVNTRRRSRLRTAATLLLLLLLAAAIAAYAYVTDGRRVRESSEKLLGELVGARVVVGQASLSIFEGLRLDDVRIYTTARSRQVSPDDGLFFAAKSLLVGYNPRALALGRIEATRILALEPHLRLVENVDERVWNFQSIHPTGGGTTKHESPGSLRHLALPEVLLRNARIDYWQIAGGRRSQVGTLGLEGQLTPDRQNLYRFRLQSRGGKSSGMFPIAEGWLSSNGDSLGVTLRDVEFVDELKTILPAVVRRFWEDHRLAGRIGETRVSYFKKSDGRPGFKVETDLDGVRLVVPPEQWLGPQEQHRAHAWQSAFATLSSPALGGSIVARRLSPAMTPKPLQLDEVDGTFVFTDTQISVSDLVARAEANRFKITGVADGYDAASPFKMRIQSLGSQDIVIPESPTYITALPVPVQQIYYRFKPRGAASFWADVERKIPAGPIGLNGELAIRDGAFSYERLPYPVDRVSGRIRMGPDPATGRELLEIVEMSGRGYAGGLNEAAQIHVSGRITPLDETAGADVVIRGRGVRNEPRLLAAMAPPMRRVIESFDANNTGLLPSFELDFESNVHLPVGLRTEPVVSTTLDIRRAAGLIRGFPYPLNGVEARLILHDDSVHIDHVTLAPGGGAAKISGEIALRNNAVTGEVDCLPDLRVEAADVPIDEPLLAALPPKVAAKLRDAGLRGNLSLSGTIKPGSGNDPFKIDFDTTLKAAAATFGGGNVAFTDLTASAKLTQDAISIPRFDARYGNAAVHGNATFDWDGARPGNAMAARITALPIDDALLEKLPAHLRPRLRSLRIGGTVDAEIEAATDTFRAVVR